MLTNQLCLVQQAHHTQPPPRCLAGTATSLTREHPLNEGNQVAMELTGAGGTGEPAGITNAGYWGGEGGLLPMHSCRLLPDSAALLACLRPVR